MLLALGYVADSSWAVLRTHQSIHSASTSMNDYELLSELRLGAIVNTAVFCILAIPAVGWFVMLFKSYRLSSRKEASDVK